MKRRRFLLLSGAGLAGTLSWPRPSISQHIGVAADPSSAIHALRIYPAIGVSRNGGSDRWFLAPEIPGMPPDDDDHYKDGPDRIKKQVQRFRIYAFDRQGRVIGEVTAEQADITWRVHLVNSKAAWYDFNNPLDNGDLAPGIPSQRRNPSVTGASRRESELVVDGGEVAIGGRNVNQDGLEQRYRFQDTFLNRSQVNLGDLRTDAQGRLLVVPGNGDSFSPTNQRIDSFADNDEWIDSWCDGPVSARVRLNGSGQTFSCESAWVVSVGPNYAPEITPPVSMYDVLENLNHDQGWLPSDNPVSFRQDIQPLLRRLDLMRWVADSALLRTAWADVGPIGDEAYLRRLADRSATTRSLRETVLRHIRRPLDRSDNVPVASEPSAEGEIPWMLGDGVNYPEKPLFYLSFTRLQYQKLERWARGDFVSDYIDAVDEPVRSFADIPLAQQPQALTRAALEACSGGAFHPGVELTYNLRHPTLYARYYDASAEPFRIARSKSRSLVLDLGPVLTSEILFHGYNEEPSPLHRQPPGGLTRWMGLPWQADVFSCQYVETERAFPQLTWWPTQIPVNVLPEDFYQLAIDTEQSSEQRRLFASQRRHWARQVAGVGYHANHSYWDGLTNMIELWQRMGFVVRCPPAPDDLDLGADLSGDFFVEVGRGVVDLPSPSDLHHKETDPQTSGE